MRTIISRSLIEKGLNTVDQVQQFLIRTQLIAFQIKVRDRNRSLVLDYKASRYKWIQGTLIRLTTPAETPGEGHPHSLHGEGQWLLPAFDMSRAVGRNTPEQLV